MAAVLTMAAMTHVRAAVAAPNLAAARAGEATAAAGGNAVDIALSAMLTAMTTEPGIVSSMGGAFVTVWPKGEPAAVVDGNVAMAGKGRPSRAFGGGLREVRTDYGGGLTLLAGHGSVAVPGAWAGLGTAHDRFGRLGWAEVLRPATETARAGYVVGQASASYLGFVGHSVFGWCEGSAAVLVPGGRVVQEGDRVVDADLAATYEHLAAAGWRDVYEGEVAAALVADMDANAGLVSAEDLATYEPQVRSALRLDVGDWELALNPPPAIGGPMLAILLGALAGRDRHDWTDTIEIQRHVLSYRAHHHDTSPDLHAAGWEALQAAERYGLEGLPTSASTAHVSVVDSEGTACAITASSGYGSGVVVPGTGLQLNNALGELELNRLGVHALAPGTPLASNMAPTVARRPDDRVLAVGSPGADRITTALMQVLGHVCLRDADLEAAIGAPRLHVAVGGALEGGVVVEHESDPGIEQAVAASGLPGHDHGPRSMFFGGVGAAQLLGDGRLEAAGDPRRSGAALVTA